MARIISVVGAGGKSTLIERLAEQFSLQGQRVCVTTTTHIYAQADRPEEKIFYCGLNEREKLAYPGTEEFSRLCCEFDVVLVEADGSRHFPLKIPAAHEPVIPEHTDEIFVVMGMHSLGRPIGEVCQRFRSADTAALTAKFPDIRATSPVSIEAIDFIAQAYYVEPLRKKFPGVPVNYVRNSFVEDFAEEKRVALILLASGFSRRFDGGNKLLHVVNGKELFRYGLDALINAKGILSRHGITARVFVTGGNVGECGCAEIIANPTRDEGISSSIRLGTKAAEENNCDAVLLLAGDQPNFPAEDIVRLVREFLCSGKLCGCAFSDHPANPGIFAANSYQELLNLSGDSGALKLIKANPAKAHYYVVSPEKLLDIDTLNDSVNL